MRPPAAIAHIRGSAPSTFALAIFLWGGIALAGGPAGAQGPVIPGGREAEIAKLPAPYTLGGEVSGFVLNGIQIGQSDIKFLLVQKAAPHEQVRLTLAVLPARFAPLADGARIDFAVDPPLEQQSSAAQAAVTELRRAVSSNVGGSFLSQLVVQPEARSAPEAHRTGPMVEPPPVRAALALWLALAVGGSIVLACLPNLRGQWRAWLSLATLTVGSAALPLVVWFVTQPLAAGSDARSQELWFGHTQQQGHAAATWSLYVALLMTFAMGLVAVVRSAAARQPRQPSALGWTIDLAAISAWSFFVRFALTTPNIMTDGGSGYGRLFRHFVPGFGGLSVLIELVLPEQQRQMASALLVSAVLAACAPTFLYLLARSLGFSRPVATFAGFALASLPLHAAMYTSDFELGPLVSLQLLGLALLASALRGYGGERELAGGAWLAYCCWGRLDALVVGAVLLALLLPSWRTWYARPAVIAALAWIGLNALATVAHAAALGGGSFARIELSLWPALPLARFLRLQEDVPFWLWLPLPLGIYRLAGDRRRLTLIAIGTMAGFAPLYFGPTGGWDPTGSYLEYFRYGSWALPWILLVTASGLEELVRLSGIHAARPALLAVCCATPLYFHDYLAREYGPRSEEHAFREALRHIPAECALVVPDDDAPEDKQRGGTHEIARRYQYINEEAASRGESALAPERVVGISPFLASIENRTTLPPVSGGDGDREPCWYFFRGSYCFTGFDIEAPASCAQLAARSVLEPVFERDIFYISHRLVTRPDLRQLPLYDPAQHLVLAKITRLATR